MKTKQQFINAVKILAPEDPFIHQAAQRIPEEKLPPFPGGAALEFVVAVQKLREPINSIPVKVSAAKKSGSNHTTSTKSGLSLSHALRVQSAEYWLKLGEADQALRELEALPHKTWNHPSAVKTRIAAMCDLREQSEIAVQE